MPQRLTFSPRTGGNERGWRRILECRALLRCRVLHTLAFERWKTTIDINDASSDAMSVPAADGAEDDRDQKRLHFEACRLDDAWHPVILYPVARSPIAPQPRSPVLAKGESRGFSSRRDAAFIPRKRLHNRTNNYPGRDSNRIDSAQPWRTVCFLPGVVWGGKTT